mmetsp:Transcript_22333/g.50438  ORF Transcript_22333/g.50438 Transcript_22333/m.50438 type:complete len:202 (+) Transcript_22333:72-677(+)
MCTHSGPAPEKPNNDTTHSHKWTHRARSLATTRKARRNTERDFLPRTRRPCKKSWAQGQLQLRAARSARSGSRTATRPASAPRAAPARTTAAARRSPATSKRRRKRRAAGSRQAAKPRHQRQGRAGPSDAQSIPEYDNGSDGDVSKCSSIVIEHGKSARHLLSARQTETGGPDPWLLACSGYPRPAGAPSRPRREASHLRF